MTPHYEGQGVTLYAGDCLNVLRGLPDTSVDAVVTDPPYGLGFMGKDWDSMAERGITRRQVDEHMGTSDMAGWWLTDHPTRCQCPTWDQWQQLRTFAKLPDDMDAEVWRLNGRKGTPGEAWATADVLRVDSRMNEASGVVNIGQGERVAVDRQVKAANSDEARTWQGWGTAMKPAFEPIVVARKPLVGTVAANVLAHGTGALNIDGTRITATDKAKFPVGYNKGMGKAVYYTQAMGRPDPDPNPSGRWPANVILDEDQSAALDQQSGTQRDGVAVNRNRGEDEQASWYGTRKSQTGADGGSGGASRFFYTAPDDDPAGGLPMRAYYTAKAPGQERVKLIGTSHPTVKPLSLMRWLVRLVTPPGGTVLEPFAGSGTTVEACLLEGFRCVAVEREADYLPLIVQRINRRRDPVAATQAADPGNDGGLW